MKYVIVQCIGCQFQKEIQSNEIPIGDQLLCEIDYMPMEVIEYGNEHE